MEQKSQDMLIERMSDWVCRHGLAVPAVLLLELHKPLSGIGGALVQFLAPGLEWVLGEQNTEDLAKLLHDRRQVERLIDRIGELDRNFSGKEVKNKC